MNEAQFCIQVMTRSTIRDFQLINWRRLPTSCRITKPLLSYDSILNSNWIWFDDYSHTWRVSLPFRSKDHSWTVIRHNLFFKACCYLYRAVAKCWLKEISIYKWPHSRWTSFVDLNTLTHCTLLWRLLRRFNTCLVWSSCSVYALWVNVQVLFDNNLIPSGVNKAYIYYLAHYEAPVCVRAS